MFFLLHHGPGKTPALARHTGNFSATMVLMITAVALRQILATQMLKVIASSQNTRHPWLWISTTLQLY